MTKNIDMAATLKSLKAIAATQMAKYPQYAWHFDRYVLARVKRDVTTKLGLAFARGEYVIAVKRDASHPMFATSPGFSTAWSRRNAVDTSIPTSDLEWL